MSENQVGPIKESVASLCSEIRQIHEQYKKEVPKKRRPWPTSIQSRILELWKLGMSSNQISEMTGLPAQTLYSWRQRINKKEPGFLPVPIVKKRHRRSNFDIQLSQLEEISKSPTVTVVTTTGLRIEGVPVNQAVHIARGLCGL